VIAPEFPASLANGHPTAPAEQADRGSDTVGFRLVMLYLLLEFGRPQDLLPALGVLRPSAVAAALLAATLLYSGRLTSVLPRTRPFQLLLVLMVLHIPIAVNNHWAFWSTFAMMQTFVVCLGILAFVNTREKQRSAALIWVGIHAILAFHANLHSGQGVGGFLGDENDVALTLDAIVPIATFLAISRQTSTRQRLLLTAMLVFVIAAIPRTMSRGGLLGLLAVSLYCALRSPRKVLALVILVVFGMLVVVCAPDGYWKKMETILWRGEGDDTGAGRLYEWKVGWKMFLANPILGVGPGNFPFRFAEYEGDMRWFDRSIAGRAAHSLYFTLLPELGILGLAIVSTMVARASRGLALVRRRDRRDAISPTEPDRFFTWLSFGFEGSLLGFLVASVFVSTLYYPNLWVLLAFMDALKQTVLEELDTVSLGAAGPRPAR